MTQLFDQLHDQGLHPAAPDLHVDLAGDPGTREATPDAP